MRDIHFVFYVFFAAFGFFRAAFCRRPRQIHLLSPCPGIFDYAYADSGVLSGSIVVNSPDESFIQLAVQLSVGNNVEGFNGNIELAYPKSQVIEDVMNRRPVRYKLHFPMWTSMPPKVTKISLNGRLVCSGPKIDNLVPVLTTINLQHTLKINAPPGVALSTAKNPAMLPSLRLDQQQQPEATTTATPKSKEIQSHAIVFKPKPPKDFAKVLARNPFLAHLAETRTKPPVKVTTKAQAHALFRFPQENEVDDDEDAFFAPETPFADLCGRSLATNPLVVNGSPVAEGAFPWLAALFVSKNLGPEFRCTATLISRRHVLTAGHCLKDGRGRLDPNDLLVVLGKTNIRRWTREEHERFVYARSIHVHQDYEPLTADADIAVVVMDEEVVFDRHVRPACLWTGSDDLAEIVGERGVVVGWGRSETGSAVTSEPRQSVLPVVGQEECLRSTYSFQFITSERTFCAGFRNGTGPCNGDSGGGFFLKRAGRWTLRGVVSMSLSDQVYKNCDLSNYVVFNDASKFTGWLLSFLA